MRSLTERNIFPSCLWFRFLPRAFLFPQPDFSLLLLHQVFVEKYKKIPMLPCISSSPPVRKMKLHLWLNVLFYYLWQNSCSYNKFTFWSWVNCLSVRSSNLLFALESDFAPVSTPDCQNNLFKRIRYFMEFRRLFKSTFVCSCACLGCECFWSDVHIERWVWQHPLGVSWMFYDLAMFWQQGGRGGFSAQWLLGEHSIEYVLFCSVLL